MKKKICIIVLILCVLVIVLKVTYDKGTDYVALKGLEVISNKMPIDEVLDNVRGEQNSTDTQTEENASTDEDITPSASSEPSQTTSGNTVDVPVDIPDGIDPADKEYVMGIYMRYTAAEVNEVYTLMSGEVTPEEKARAKQIVFAKMSRAEYRKLLELARKYGY